MTNEERFDLWWADNALDFVDDHDSSVEYRLSKLTARAAFMAAVPPDDVRQALIDAAGIAYDRYATVQGGRTAAQRYAAARKWLEGE